MLQTVFSYLLDMIFPPRCPLCRCYTAKQAIFCPECLRRILYVRRVPLKRTDIKHLHCVYALTHYRNGADKLISQLKYRGDMRYLPHIHALTKAYVPKDLAIDAVVPVPLHCDKWRERGFNQAEKIFAPWSNSAGIPWLDSLERHKATLPQYTLAASARRQNVKDAFSLKDSADIYGKRILLVDDIFTTGMTMEACAKVLYRAGAIRVDGLVLASDA